MGSDMYMAYRDAAPDLLDEAEAYIKLTKSLLRDLDVFIDSVQDNDLRLELKSRIKKALAWKSRDIF